MAEFEPQIVAFCCTHCAYNAADLAGSLRIQYPSAIKIIQVLVHHVVHGRLLLFQQFFYHF
ncbi:MAG: hydrogenase iron-sulfur subunit [Anaerolineales bacterium]